LQTQIKDLPAQIDRILEDNKRLERELAAFKQQTVLGALDELIEGAEKLEDGAIVVAEVEAASPEDMRTMGDRIRDRLDPVAIMLAAKNEDKVLFLSMVSKSLVKKGVHAGQVVKTAAQICGGGGGGRPDMAQAGGRIPEKLPEALAKSKILFGEQMKGIK